MAEVEFQFTEYFDGETVVISSAGRELHRAEQLKTDVRKSFARIVKVAVPPGQAVLTFEVPSRGISRRVSIDASQLKFVRVALRDGRLEIEPVSEDDFRREPRGFG